MTTFFFSLLRLCLNLFCKDCFLAAQVLLKPAAPVAQLLSHWYHDTQLWKKMWKDCAYKKMIWQFKYNKKYLSTTSPILRAENLCDLKFLPSGHSRNNRLENFSGMKKAKKRNNNKNASLQRKNKNRCLLIGWSAMYYFTGSVAESVIRHKCVFQEVWTPKRPCVVHILWKCSTFLFSCSFTE